MNFDDPTGAARAATLAVAAYALLDLAWALSSMLFPIHPVEFGISDFIALVEVLAYLASAVLVGRWIWRTNSNAHGFSDGVSITPGWSVGWFFVPFANLVKPYQGVKETWNASHELAGSLEQLDSPLLGWWWGLWLLTNFASTISVRIELSSNYANPGLLVFNLIIALVNIALCIILVQIMQRLSRAQLIAHHGGVFA